MKIINTDLKKIHFYFPVDGCSILDTFIVNMYKVSHPSSRIEMLGTTFTHTIWQMYDNALCIAEELQGIELDEFRVCY